MYQHLRDGNSYVIPQKRIVVSEVCGETYLRQERGGVQNGLRCRKSTQQGKGQTSMVQEKVYQIDLNVCV